MEKIHKLILLLQGYFEKKWFGKVTISFEGGNIVHVKAEESIKL